MSIGEHGTISPSTQVRLRLYGTSGCHLCDQAFAMLYPLAQTEGWMVEPVDIADDGALLDCYGERIPVLANPCRGRELDWPFTLEQVHTLVMSGRDEVP